MRARARAFALSPQPWTSGMWWRRQNLRAQKGQFCPSVAVLAGHLVKAHETFSFIAAAITASKSSSISRSNALFLGFFALFGFFFAFVALSALGGATFSWRQWRACSVRLAEGICLPQLSQVNVVSLPPVGQGGDFTTGVWEGGDCADVVIQTSPLSLLSSDDGVRQVTLVSDTLLTLDASWLLTDDARHGILCGLLTTMCLSIPSPRLKWTRLRRSAIYNEPDQHLLHLL